MSSTKYKNFVQAIPPTPGDVTKEYILSGEEAKKIYLEEIKGAPNPISGKLQHSTLQITSKTEETHLSDKDLFVTVQNNDVDTLKDVLSHFPERINSKDEFGWSLLMIACQANSVETVRELLSRGIDTSVRDKAGNSASSLVIRNKNYILADLLLSCIEKESKPKVKRKSNAKCIEEYNCEICNKTFLDKDEHLSSTVHNISASKGKKIPTNYVIPSTNKGYQIMLRVGWDKESGLGPDGSGKKYPIKTIQKKDRQGLGHGKRKLEEIKDDTVRHKNMKSFARDCHNKRKLEINFRREFY